MARKKKRLRQYKATRSIQWGDVPFTLAEGQEFTKADLMPGMEAALRKWIRVGAAVAIKQIIEKQEVIR